MSHTYPRIVENGRKPHPDRDGTLNYGKPCVRCGVGTVGSKWVEVNYFRGEDEEIRVCSKCWKTPVSELIKLWEQTP